MRKTDRNTIIVISVILFVFLGGFLSITLYSEHNPPFSVIVSQSMQHDEEKSTLGSLDTGDMVLVRNKEKVNIQTYIQGYTTGFHSFGEYGSVLIYNTPCEDKIIHRAILYMEIYEEAGKKYAKIPYLDSYPYHSLDSNHDMEKIDEDFYIIKKNGNIPIQIPISNILKRTEVGTKGYVTMGDNNLFVDQSFIFISKLIEYEDIISIPVLEIPWLGCIKLIINGDGEKIEIYAPNSINNLIITGFSMILILFSIISLYILYYAKKRNI